MFNQFNYIYIYITFLFNIVNTTTLLIGKTLVVTVLEGESVNIACNSTEGPNYPLLNPIRCHQRISRQLLEQITLCFHHYSNMLIRFYAYSTQLPHRFFVLNKMTKVVAAATETLLH